MDTSELLAWLRRRVEETARDRDRLSEAVEALEGEIGKLEEDERRVAQLVSRFATLNASQTASSTTPSRHNLATEPGGGHKTAAWSWPDGPRGPKRAKAIKPKAWARSKLAAAGWYLDVLRSLDSSDEFADRAFRIDMATDGVIQSLCASFDAATFALTGTLEKAADIPRDRRTPAHLTSWSKVAAEAKLLSVDLASALSVGDALVGEHSPTPRGWLAQLQMLRAMTSRQNLISIDPPGDASLASHHICIPFHEPQPLLQYLSTGRDLMEELLETMFHDISSIKHGKLSRSRKSQLRDRAEQELESLLPGAK